MARRVSISLRAARDLLTVLCDVGFSGRPTVEELRAAMAPKRSVGASRVRRVAKKATKKEETAAIREAVMKRAGGFCECGCGTPFTFASDAFRAELDHFFPKARTPQTVRTCWALTAPCHYLKTQNEPTARLWLEKFIAHARRHRYGFEEGTASRRLEALELSGRAASVTRGAP